jgi:T-complex protein 1 subunit zeta
MAAAVVEAIQTIYTPASSGREQPLDLNRIEILTLPRNAAADSRLVKGLVLDHGNRHPDMPSHLHGGSGANGGVVYIMTCNISLEYEQTETQATFVYQTAEEREKLVESERQWLDERCRKIVAFKRSVCDAGNDIGGGKKHFCIINQKGVDPLSLDMFAKEGILCLRRAKRRNMERLVLAVGGSVILSLEDELTVDMLGQAGSVRVVSYGGDDNKYTFIEDCRPLDHLEKNKSDDDKDQHSSPASLNKSCTLLLQGPNSLTVHQIQDAVKDGLRSVKNAVEDAALIPGGGALELACHEYLMNVVAPATPGKPKVGIQAYAQALLVIPKTLAANSGFDVQEAILAMQEEYRQTTMASAGEGTKTTTSDGATYTIPKLQYDLAVGFSCKTGEPMLSAEEGVWDNVRVKRQSLYLATVLANQLLLVDEVMRAGKQMGRQPPQGGGDDPMMM